MLVSIIVPVYNVRDYLLNCIESIIRECSNIEYEVILVDDGSTDGSAELCDEAASRSERFKVFHKANGGLSDARNFGVERAEGDYIFYLDSDDFLVNEGVKCLLDVALKWHSDVVCGNFYYHYPQEQVIFDKDKYGVSIFRGGEEALTALLEGKRFQNFAWGKLIRKDLAVRNRFPKGKLFEDVYWFYKVLHEADQVASVDAPVVHYLQRNSSISFQYKLNNLDILEGYVERLRFFELNYVMLVNKQKCLMAESCFQHAWMINRFIISREKPYAIQRLRDIILGCGLQENPLLDFWKKIKIKMVLANLKGFCCIELIEKITNRLMFK